MTHIANIPHILQYGITHRNSPNANPNYVPIGDSSLINFRATKCVAINNCNIKIILGDFIPFYFGIRMPMLYVMQHGWNFVAKPSNPEEIIYIVISLSKIIDNDFEFYFSDGHATDFLTTFYSKNDIKQLPAIIDWKAITAKYWSGDGIETDIKRRKQAEFIVKQDIPSDFIIGFGCYNEIAKFRLMSIGIKENSIKIIPQAYYEL